MGLPRIEIRRSGRYTYTNVDLWPTRSMFGPDMLGKLEDFFLPRRGRGAFYTSSRLIVCIRCKASREEMKEFIEDILAGVVPDNRLAQV